MTMIAPKKRAAGAFRISAGGQKHLKSRAAALALLPALALAQLNDTGQTQCASGAAMTACAAATAGQDGAQGRDARAAAGQLAKAGAGAAGFDFTALDALGMATAAGGHDCVADNVTGLVWSTETLAARSWADAAGAGAGYGRCDIADGWRLPSRRELLSLVHHGANGPAIDGTYFPGTASAPYWSADAAMGGQAWAVDFGDGATRRDMPAQTHALRLVARTANVAPTLTPGADIVVPREDRPGPLTFPGWATGIAAGPAREAGQQLTATVELLPLVDGDPKALEFDVPPALDLATGDLSFTIKHRIDPPTINRVQEWWVSSAGLARVRVTLRDDGGTSDGGQDTTSAEFTIFLDPVPAARDHNIKHPWKAACIPVTLAGFDADTDPEPGPDYVPLVSPYPYPRIQIVTQPSEGFLVNDLYGIGGDSYYGGGMGPTIPGHEYGGLFFNYAFTLCWIPFSSTWTGSDTFTYRVVDPDGNVSNTAAISIEIFEI